MSDFTPRPDLEFGRYQHYKGGEYEVIALACDEETHEWRVIYQALYDTEGLPDVWDRNYEVFVGSVALNGAEVPRFKKIDKD